MYRDSIDLTPQPYAATMQTANDSTSYLLGYDQAGSLKAVAAMDGPQEGRVVKVVDYDAFGQILSDSNPALFIPLAFAGGLRDRFTGLVRFCHRDYDPTIGRFTAPDPLGDTGGDHDLYDYCVDDPVGRVDPEGLQFVATPGAKIEEDLMNDIRRKLGVEGERTPPRVPPKNQGDYDPETSARPRHDRIPDDGGFRLSRSTLSASGDGGEGRDDDSGKAAESDSAPRGGQPRQDKQDPSPEEQARKQAEVNAEVAQIYGVSSGTLGSSRPDEITTSPEEAAKRLKDANWVHESGGLYYDRNGNIIGEKGLEEPDPFLDPVDWVTVGLSAKALAGREIKIGNNLRIAPFGNRTDKLVGELPHYHRRALKSDGVTPMEGQGLNRHRPWQTKSTDKSFWDRF